MTPALTRQLSASATYPTYGLRLDTGDLAVPSVEREIVDALPPGSTYSFHLTSVVEGQVERATKPEAIALGVFGVIAGLAALLIGAQAISRRLWANRGDLDVLRSLGADTPTMAADAMLGPLCAVVLGALLAVGVAVAFSPLMPIGPASQVDPSPGIAFDWTVLVVGSRGTQPRSRRPHRRPRVSRGHATRPRTARVRAEVRAWSTSPPGPGSPNRRSPVCASRSSAAAVAPRCPSARRSWAPCWRWRSWWRPSPSGAVSPPSTPTPPSTAGTGATPSTPPAATTSRRSSGTSSVATRTWPRGPGTRSPTSRSTA